MFFILNNEGTVIAADKPLLDHIDVESVYVLAEGFRSSEIALDEQNNTLHFSQGYLPYTKDQIQTVFGVGYIYHLTIREDDIQLVKKYEPAPETWKDVPPLLQDDDKTSEASVGREKEIPLDAKVPGKEEESSRGLDAGDLLKAAPAAAVATVLLNKNDRDNELPDLLDLDKDITQSIERAKTEDTIDTIKVPDINLQSDATPGLTVDIGDDALDIIEEEQEDVLNLVSDKKDDALSLINDKKDDALGFIDDKKDDALKVVEDNNDILDLIDADTKVSDELFVPKQDIKESVDVAKTDSALVQETIADTGEKFDLVDPLADINEKNDEALSRLQEVEPATPVVPPATYKASDGPFANYHENAELIGITHDEYLVFMKQFVDEALESENELRSADLRVFKNGLTSIKDTAQLLYLPKLSIELEKMDGATSEERQNLVNVFVAKVKHIKRDMMDKVAPLRTETVESAPPQVSQEEPKNIIPTLPDTETPHMAGINLDDIKPIPFNFSTKTASDELGLPESLVNEFVVDFIQQAKENILTFEQAQQKGDIETIQKTAHLLKGAASNLRIDTMADTLKDMQYNDDLGKVSPLFKQFLGQLKMLEIFTNEQSV